MKTEEDEAFEEIERRQGGGFTAKRQMAADKLQEEDWDVIAEKQLASIKRDTQASFEDAMVRATHKVMAELEAQPVQEPVAEVVWGAKTGFEWKFKMLVELACVEDVPVKLYAGEFKGANVYWHDTAPPKREWVGLTDEEIDKTYWAMPRINKPQPTQLEFARAIEQMLKEKNNG